tara:strand:- start:3983 stop:6400 length:2418 start_codon:yes stop_codon:yes gene_type:complete
MDITIFKDIKQTSQPFYRDVDIIINRIKNGASKEIVKKIRAEKNKDTRKLLKAKLPAICFSGKFSKRADNALIEHSGVICLDFDEYKTKKAMLEEKQRLSKDKNVFSVFVSPSGNGLKVLVKIPPKVENHRSYFISLQNHFNSKNFDRSCKNVSRVCYESYDPLIYTNHLSSLWDKIEEQQYVEVMRNIDMPTIPVTDGKKITDILIRWWAKKYPWVEGNRNNHTYILAAAFNDYGINQSLAEHIFLSNYQSSNFTEYEIRRTIKSAYAKTSNFNTKYYEDEDKVNDIKMKLKRGVHKKDIRTEMEDDDVDGNVIEKVITRLDEENKTYQFWTKNDKGVIKIIPIFFKEFLETNGFNKFNPTGSKNFVFVKVTDNLIDHTSEKEIKDFVLSYLIKLEDYTVYNYFAEGTRFFREEFLTLLSSIDVHFIEDDKDNAYLYYKNGAVQVKHGDLKLIPYLDLGGFVWKDHVIDRDFKLCDSATCDYQKFILNISGGNELIVKSFRSTIGYLLHAWKNLSYSPAIILNDEVISDNPEGGTGKGLFMNALGHMKKLVVIDGKSFNFEKSFAYQLVSADTQILCFDDVKKFFDFERLFSLVTEGLTLEKKNKDAIKIPFHKSPKVAITTNYAIAGEGSSFERRKWELELSQYYTNGMTPLVDLGKLMFGEWDDDEWCAFDNYMIECLQIYMKYGLIKADFKNKKLKSLIVSTNTDFTYWCGITGDKNVNMLLVKGRKIYINHLYLDFLEINGETGYAKKSVSLIRFGKWIKAYSKYKYECEPEGSRDDIGNWVRFISKHDLESNGELDMDF